jgi:hypothetical protein
MHRALRAMGVIGLVHEHRGAHFSLTPLGAAFRTDAPASAKWPTLTWCVYTRVCDAAAEMYWRSDNNEQHGVWISYGSV